MWADQVQTSDPRIAKLKREEKAAKEAKKKEKEEAARKAEEEAKKVRTGFYLISVPPIFVQFLKRIIVLL